MPEDTDAQFLTQGLHVETRGKVFAILPALLGPLSSIHGMSLSAASLESAERVQAARGRSGPVPQGGVAVLPLKGLLTPGMTLMQLLFGGGGGLADFNQALQQAAADPEVKSIVMDVDSPGGYVDQIPEVAASIRAAGEQKPIVAVANTTAASAAYWLASQAHELVVTPSGEVGSIGVYQIHYDESQAWAAEGVVPTIIKAGKYKIEGNPYSPLSDEARQAMQDGVDDYYNLFTADVAAGRGTTQDEVQSGMGEGRMLTAKRAVRAGLADRVATLAQTVTRLQSGRAKVRRAPGMGSSRNILEWEGDPDESFVPVVGEEQTASGTTVSAEDRGRLFDTLAGLR